MEDLQVWYKSMRTMYGKLSQHKSGDGCRELTERDKWVKESFSFLSRHIVRVVSRQAVSVSIVIIKKKTEFYLKYLKLTYHYLFITVPDKIGVEQHK